MSKDKSEFDKFKEAVKVIVNTPKEKKRKPKKKPTKKPKKRGAKATITHQPAYVVGTEKGFLFIPPITYV